MQTHRSQQASSVLRAGVLADTHLIRPDSQFITSVRNVFAECKIVIHAGDLTDLSVLATFAGKTVHAVCGNMCATAVRAHLPGHLLFKLGRFTIGLTHGAGLGHDIEGALMVLFPEADCVIYGHTHRPVCHRHGSTLFLNPGSFRATGPHGAPGTCAILEAGDELTAHLVTLSPTP